VEMFVPLLSVAAAQAVAARRAAAHPAAITLLVCKCRSL